MYNSNILMHWSQVPKVAARHTMSYTLLAVTGFSVEMDDISQRKVVMRSRLS